MSASASARSSAHARAAAEDAAIVHVDWTLPPAGSTASRFRAPSGDLAVRSLGDSARPRVVLVPGATGSKEDFALMLPILAEGGHFVQTFDLAGQYESAGAGPPAGEQYTYELFERDLISFLEEGEPAHLLGYSFAGIVAQRVAIRRPDLVRSLALLTTPPAHGNVFRRMKIIGPLAPLATPRIGAALMLWGIRNNLNRAPSHRISFVRHRLGSTRRSSIDDIVGLMMHAPDLRARVRALGIPALVATGAHDLWPTRLHESFADDIGAWFCCYDTGHSPCETAPRQLCLDLLDLYRRG